MKKSPEYFEKGIKEENPAKQQIMETLSELTIFLTTGDNYKIVDEAVGETGMSAELAEKLQRYSEKLGSKYIEIDSSAQDLLKNIYGVLGLVELIKTKGPKPIYTEKLESNARALIKYIDILSSDRTIEKGVLGKGFLKNEKFIPATKAEYVEKLEERRRTP